MGETTMSLKDGSVSCLSCGSTNLDEFMAETGIRRSGLKNVDKPAVFVFSELIVCKDCGRAEFAVPEAELHLLAKGDDAAAANVG